MGWAEAVCESDTQQPCAPAVWSIAVLAGPGIVRVLRAQPCAPENWQGRGGPVL